MILLEPLRMTLRHYLNTLADYELHGSTANTKILGAPFAWGRVSITYAEPGLAVMRSDMQLGEEMLLLKPKGEYSGAAPVDTMHFFAFISIVANDSVASLLHGQVMETATGAQDLIAYACNDNAILAAYPPGYITNSVVVQVGGWWLAEFLPDLAARHAALKEQGALKNLCAVPASSLQKLAMYRNNFDTRLPYGEESSRQVVKNFLLYCHSLAYTEAAEEDTASQPAIAGRIDALVQEIMRDIHKPLPSVAQMSIRAGINIHTLRACFIRYYGKSPFEYFTEQQMAWAEEELTIHNASVKSVGFRIGYQNLSHFAANFRKFRGKLPGELTIASRHS